MDLTETHCYKCKKNIDDDEFGYIEYLGKKKYSTICSTCYMHWINNGGPIPSINNIQQIELKTRSNFMYSWQFDAIQAETSVFEKYVSGEITIDEAITNLELLPEILKKYAQSKDDSEKSETKLMVQKMQSRLDGLKRERDTKVTTA